MSKKAEDKAEESVEDFLENFRKKRTGRVPTKKYIVRFECPFSVRVVFDADGENHIYDLIEHQFTPDNREHLCQNLPWKTMFAQRFTIKNIEKIPVDREFETKGLPNITDMWKGDEQLDS